MAEGPMIQRHYAKVAGLVPRTSSDISPEAMEGRFYALDFLRNARDPLPDHPRLISSAHGDIQELLLTIPAYTVVRPAKGLPNPLAQVYRDLLSKLPKGSRLIVLTHESVQVKISRWLKTAKLIKNAIIISVPDHLNFSIWAEDGYVVVEDQESGSRYLLEPYEFPRYGDGLIADFVRNQSHLGGNQAPLYFQGGNILISDDFFLIGADYPANTLRRYINKVIVPNVGEAPAAAVHRLYREYMDTSRNLIYVGSTIPVPAETRQPIVINGEQWTEILYFGNREGTVQPLFHIDMFITLAGRDASGVYRILVGDPQMAAEALDIPLWPHGMQAVFDNIARGLSRQGFQVIRNPLPLVYVDDPESKERMWYFATANNALVQLGGQAENHVWLPTYGHGNWVTLQKTDQMNREIWESLGFSVSMLGDFHPFAENLGAVHCIKKYLNRV
jgi:hypothetical protein